MAGAASHRRPNSIGDGTASEGSGAGKLSEVQLSVSRSNGGEALVGVTDKLPKFEVTWVPVRVAGERVPPVSVCGASPPGVTA